MASLIVGGGESLRGSLWIQGSKNAALPMIAAAVLNRGITKIYHCPAISDVDNMLEIMKSLGCCIERTGEYVLIDSSQMDVRDISPEYAASMRSSVFLMGSASRKIRRGQPSLSRRLCHREKADRYASGSI